MSVSKVLGFASIVILLSGCQSWQKTDFDAMPPTAALPPTSQVGVVELRYWDNIAGNKVDALTTNAAYPDNPDEVLEINRLQGVVNRGSNYGSLVRGFIIPPADGRYRFYVAGDDETQFWFSMTNNPSDIALVASVPGWTNPESYTKYSSQTSPEMTLSSGERYYFEIRHKDGPGGDHFSVAWDGPGFSRQIVEGAALASLGQSQVPDGEDISRAYGLGYRAGFLDGTEDLPFRPDYPMLDQDQDGLYDNWEIVHGLDPTDPSDATSDQDSDLLTATDEFWLGTNPNNPDTDGDGIPDGVEFAFELDPLNPADADEDLDGDGVTNLQEYLAGTDMSDPEDYPSESEGISYVSGFVGQYFTGTDFNQFVASRNDVSVDFDWGSGAPMSGIPVNNFSARWVGVFTAPHTSGSRDYRFTTRTDDGVRLYLNNQAVIDQWKGQAATNYSHAATLGPQEEVAVALEYFEGPGGAVAQLSITDESTGQQVSTAETVKAPDPDSSATQDTGGDGIPDSWAIRHGLNPWTNNATQSQNADGISNLQAYQSGLHPWTLEDIEPPTGALPSEPTPEEPVTPPPTTTGSVTISWTAPLTRVDGSSISLSEIESYEIRYGRAPDELTQTVTSGGDQTSTEITGLETGTWYFAIRVIDSNGLGSAMSSTVQYGVQ